MTVPRETNRCAQAARGVLPAAGIRMCGGLMGSNVDVERATRFNRA